MGWFERTITPGREYHKPLTEIEDDVFLDIGATRGTTTKFWMQLVLASIIAAGGVIGDATPAVIGAMIIAPLGTPIYGLALAAVTGDRRALRSSLTLLVSGVAVNILIGVIIGLITVNRMPIDVNPQIVGRTAPAVLDLTVAIAVGIAGSFALARRDVADILAGVVRGEVPCLEGNHAVVETGHGVGIRTPTHLYGLPFRPGTRELAAAPHYFWDIAADPFELQNLAGSGAQPELAQDLDLRLRDWDRATPWA